MWEGVTHKSHKHWFSIKNYDFSVYTLEFNKSKIQLKSSLLQKRKSLQTLKKNTLVYKHHYTNKLYEVKFKIVRKSIKLLAETLYMVIKQKKSVKCNLIRAWMLYKICISRSIRNQWIYLNYLESPEAFKNLSGPVFSILISFCFPFFTIRDKLSAWLWYLWTSLTTWWKSWSLGRGLRLSGWANMVTK